MRAAIDTGALLALASPRDQYHDRAVRTAREFVRRGGKWVGTTLVLAELHGHLLRWRGPAVARDTVRSLLADTAFAWHDAALDLVEEALAGWLVRFTDQPFSLTDAVTFALMRRERLRDAFAFDQHFVIAGFRLLE